MFPNLNINPCIVYISTPQKNTVLVNCSPAVCKHVCKPEHVCFSVHTLPVFLAYVTCSYVSQERLNDSLCLQAPL